MGYHPKHKLQGRKRRKVRVRKKIFGTAERPRISVYRSARHIYAQVIDDVSGTTLASASTVAKDLRGEVSGKKSERAKSIGSALAKVCQDKGVNSVIFDRNGYRYHGRVKAIAEGARAGGLKL